MINLEIAFHRMPFSVFWEGMGRPEAVQETEQKKEKEKDSALHTPAWADLRLLPSTPQCGQI